MKINTLSLRRVSVFIIFHFLILGKALCCSCLSFASFCEATDTSSIVVRAEILDSIVGFENADQHARSIKILDNIHKKINSDTVLLIGGDGGLCLQDLSIFDIGDTLILSFPVPIPLEDTTQFYLGGLCGKFYMKFENGKVSGLTASGYQDQDFETFIQNFPYCVDFTSPTNEVLTSDYNIQFAPVPVQDQLRISLEANSILQYEIFHINGQLITSQYGLNEKQLILNWEDWEIGLYVVRLVLEDGVFTKVVPKA